MLKAGHFATALDISLSDLPSILFEKSGSKD